MWCSSRTLGMQIAQPQWLGQPMPIGIDRDVGHGSARLPFRLGGQRSDQPSQGLGVGESARRDPVPHASGRLRWWIDAPAWGLLRIRSWARTVARSRGGILDCRSLGRRRWLHWRSEHRRCHLTRRRQARILQSAPQKIPFDQRIEIRLDAEHLHDGQIGADRHTRAAALQAAQGHRRHACALADLLGRQAATPPCQAQPVTELAQQRVGGRQQKGNFFGYSANLLAIYITNSYFIGISLHPISGLARPRNRPNA